MLRLAGPRLCWSRSSVSAGRVSAFAAGGFPIFGTPTEIWTDSSNYYAAGLRLNAGHHLYSFLPGDRAVPMSPPYWTVPILAPPPIAVFWRLPALLGDTSMVIWWAASTASVLGTVLFIARRATLPVLAAICLFSPTLAFSAVSGNANSFLVLLAGRRSRGSWLAAPPSPWSVSRAPESSPTSATSTPSASRGPAPPPR